MAKQRVQVDPAPILPIQQSVSSPTNVFVQPPSQAELRLIDFAPLSKTISSFVQNRSRDAQAAADEKAKAAQQFAEVAAADPTLAKIVDPGERAAAIRSRMMKEGIDPAYAPWTFENIQLLNGHKVGSMYRDALMGQVESTTEIVDPQTETLRGVKTPEQVIAETYDQFSGNEALSDFHGRVAFSEAKLQADQEFTSAYHKRLGENAVKFETGEWRNQMHKAFDAVRFGLAPMESVVKEADAAQAKGVPNVRGNLLGSVEAYIAELRKEPHGAHDAEEFLHEFAKLKIGSVVIGQDASDDQGAVRLAKLTREMHDQAESDDRQALIDEENSQTKMRRQMSEEALSAFFDARSAGTSTAAARDALYARAKEIGGDAYDGSLKQVIDETYHQFNKGGAGDEKISRGVFEHLNSYQLTWEELEANRDSLSAEDYRSAFVGLKQQEEDIANVVNTRDVSSALEAVKVASGASGIVDGLQVLKWESSFKDDAIAIAKTTQGNPVERQAKLSELSKQYQDTIEKAGTEYRQKVSDSQEKLRSMFVSGEDAKPLLDSLLNSRIITQEAYDHGIAMNDKALDPDAALNFRGVQQAVDAYVGSIKANPQVAADLAANPGSEESLAFGFRTQIEDAIRAEYDTARKTVSPRLLPAHMATAARRIQKEMTAELSSVASAAVGGSKEDLRTQAKLGAQAASGDIFNTLTFPENRRNITAQALGLSPLIDKDFAQTAAGWLSRSKDTTSTDALPTFEAASAELQRIEADDTLAPEVKGEAEAGIFAIIGVPYKRLLEGKVSSAPLPPLKPGQLDQHGLPYQYSTALQERTANASKIDLSTLDINPYVTPMFASRREVDEFFDKNTIKDGGHDKAVGQLKALLERFKINPDSHNAVYTFLHSQQAAVRRFESQ